MTTVEAYRLYNKTTGRINELENELINSLKNTSEAILDETKQLQVKQLTKSITNLIGEKNRVEYLILSNIKKQMKEQEKENK